MNDEERIAQELIGVEIGGYRITDLLGSGGMGAVFRATHKSLNLRVAIKVMLPPGKQGKQGKRETDVQRFLDEARALSEVEHSSLVKLYDSGTLPTGTIFMQMELLQGETLDARLKRLGGPLSLESVVELGRQMASALQVVHERGIIHRDLKPHNVMVVTDREAIGGERAKLLDFGIAKFLRDGISHTETGQPIGTPRYMSPEQCEATSHIDERTDVYSLGLLLFEMMTGSSPYPIEEEGTMPWLFAHVERRPRTVRQLRAEVPAELDTLVATMLDKRPRQRPTMAEVEAALRRGPGVLDRSDIGKISIEPEPQQHKQQTGRTASHDPPQLPLVSRRLLLAPAIGGLLIIGAVITVYVWRHPLRNDRHGLRGGIAQLFGPSLAKRAEDLDMDSAIAAARAPAGMAFIPGQPFIMGSTAQETEAAYQECTKIAADCEREEFEREHPQRAVTLGSFYIDKHEIKNRDYADWLNRPLVQSHVEQDRLVVGGDQALLADLYAEQGGIEYVAGKFRARAGKADKPAVQITWSGAQRYCATLGKSLPTEAQWELAARSPGRHKAQTAWPWGNEFPRCDGVVIARTKGGLCQRPSPGPDDVGTATQDVTPQGVHDLAGNVREWVVDVFAIPYSDCGSCIDPVVPNVHPGAAGPGYRVVRGGNWYQNPMRARSTTRGRMDESGVSPTIGFRCATSVVR